MTLNPHLIIDEHPLPTLDELFTSMAGGTTFTKIDLKQAYLQLKVRPQDRDVLTLNTSFGLYKPTRLMYDVAAAPAIWQREMENILREIPGVSVFLDDIKVTGSTDEEHLQRLEPVFTRLNKFRIKINRDKCEFFKDKIYYCGYVIDRYGIHKDPNKIQSIKEMPRPQNATQVRAFIGFINYYGRFIKNLNSILHPLHKLLSARNPFTWTQECEKAFQTAKIEFGKDELLAHLDPKLPLVLATNASAYSMGAVLSHVYPDGTERPI